MQITQEVVLPPLQHGFPALRSAEQMLLSVTWKGAQVQGKVSQLGAHVIQYIC